MNHQYIHIVTNGKSMFRFISVLLVSLIFVNTGTGQTIISDQFVELQPSVTNADDGYGHVVHLTDAIAVVGAFLDSSNMMDKAGTLYVFDRSDVKGAPVKLIGSAVGPEDRLGYQLSASDSVVVSSTIESGRHPTTSVFDGSYVFEMVADEWQETARLYPGTDSLLTVTGECIENTNSTIVMGLQEVETGAKFLYTYGKIGDSWVQVDSLAVGQMQSCAMDGSTLLTSAPSSDFGAAASGSVSVYYRDGDSWSLDTTFTASDYAADVRFGSSIAMSGSHIVVGSSPGMTTPPQVYVYERTGTTWNEVAKIGSFGNQTFVAGRVNVAVSDTYLAASQFAWNSAGANSGVTFIWEILAGGTFIEKVQLQPVNLKEGSGFGYSLSLSGDHLLVGADSHIIGDGIGSAYMYDLELAIASGLESSESDLEPNQLLIFPNPASKTLHIESSSMNMASDQHVLIYDVRGREILSIRTSGDPTVSLDVSDLANGVYFVRIDDQVGKVVIAR